MLTNQPTILVETCNMENKEDGKNKRGVFQLKPGITINRIFLNPGGPDLLIPFGLSESLLNRTESVVYMLERVPARGGRSKYVSL